ncbi:hypothetical protein [Streptomyces sp. NRRL F-5630]|uniref:hypothetical protein n=1 Tax=unclassified Streptomyces TaxID=2593676 RepID=UPI0004C82715|nr:hypothetical protein [Streptomyces sp. NRRL F-5630]
MAPGRPRWNASAQRWEHGRSAAASAPVREAAPYVVAPARKARPFPDETVLPSVTWDPGPPSSPSGGPPRWRDRRALTLATAVVVAAGAVVLTWSLLAKGDDPAAHRPAGTTVAPSAAEEGDPYGEYPYEEAPSDDEQPESERSDEAGDEPSADASALPDGFVTADDPAGYALAVPGDWERSEKDASVYYTSPDGLSLLQVFEITGEGLTPEDALTASSDDLRARTERYEQITLGPTRPGRENPAGDEAELVYSYYNRKTGGTRLGIERAFTASDGKRYAVLAAAPDETEKTQRKVLETALAHFEPPSD